MNKYHCKYHPLEVATWFSVTRQVGYCHRCVLPANSADEGMAAQGALNGEPLEYLGHGHRMLPLSHSMGAFFRAPFRGKNLILLGFVAAIIFPVMGLIGGAGSLLHWAAIIFVLWLLSLIAGLVLRQQLIQPLSSLSITVLQAKGQWQVANGLALINAVYGGLLAGSYWLDFGWLHFWCGVVFVLAWPASTMLQATNDDNPLAALQPLELVQWIKKIGWNYGLLVVLVVALYALARVLVAVFWAEFPFWLSMALGLMLLLYCMLVASYAMGYLLQQYGALWEDLSALSSQRIAKNKANWQEQKLQWLMQDGSYQEAVKCLLQAIQQQPNSVLLHERIARLFEALGDRDQAFAHGERFLPLLYEQGDSARLYFQYVRYKNMQSDFMPKQPELRYQLAQQLYSRGQFQDVCRLLVKLHQLEPEFADIPKAYLLLAQTLLEGFDAKEKAAQYLLFIQKKCPAFQQMEMVNDLLGQCRR